MAEPPYSDEFIDLIVEIIEPIAESLDKAMDVKTVVWEFLSKYLIAKTVCGWIYLTQPSQLLDAALNREEPINPNTRETIVTLQRRF
jgi:hypothetical protein